MHYTISIRHFNMSLLFILWLLIDITLLFTLNSCVPIPVPIGAFTRKPYSSEKLQVLFQKDADKGLVKEVLGYPQAERLSGRYWFYASNRETVGFIGGGDLVFDGFEWVAIHFDNSDHVDFLEYNDSVDGCLTNGICNYSGLLYSNPSLAVLSAPKDKDQFIKSYRADEDECTIYFYLEPVSMRFASGQVILFVDGSPEGVINYKTYLFLKHPAGDVLLEAYQFEIKEQCRKGERIYLKAVESWKSYETGKDLKLVDEGEGESAIRSRKLALPY